ncbi:MAG: hypothetical protein AMJ62_06090 [Myxococcales bacterium SG8_38]|nr:MAG: hypothetical protein AMJ62_06090 [Myxococcales bacterium SG8_38]
MPKAKPDRENTRLRTALVGELALRLANQVIEGCAERDVTLMPLKGVLLLGRWPALRGRRGLVDIDLLARASDFETVTGVLRALGFEPTVQSSAGSTFSSEAWPLSIDLHHDLFPHALFRMSTEGVFSRAELDASLFAAPVARMSDEDLLAHLIGHFVKGRGTFREDTSLDDIRWLLEQDLFRLERAGALAAHFRELGLKRAAGYVLGHDSFRDERIPSAVLGSLRLSRLDRITIAIAYLGTKSNGGSPRWWTPHLLDRGFLAGSRSLFTHADEARRRYIAALAEGGKSMSRAGS